MNTLPRSKKIMAMLNKDIKKRFTPQNNKQKRKKSNNDLDSDYQPDSEDDLDSLHPEKMIQVHSHNRISGSNLLQVSSLLPASLQPGTSFQDLSNSENEIDIVDAEAVQCSSFDNKNEESLPAAIASSIIEELIDLTISEILKKVTKKGTLRKRRKFDIPLSSRIAAKRMKRVLKHSIVKPPCSSTCFLKCSLKLNEERRKVIYQQYWESPSDIQKNFLLNHVNREKIKRRTVFLSTEPLRKSRTFNYFLKDDVGDLHRVCKTFFLGTIGYSSHDDRFLRSITSSDNDETVIYTPKSRTRGTPNKKIDRKVIIDHISSFGPTISHYRRAHAPKRLYLPSDINIAYMHKHFQEKYPSMTASYTVYRQEVADQNISFVKLGHEECWSCEIFELHCKQIGHEKNKIPDDCNVCQKWNTHKERANLSREAYQQDSKSDTEPGRLIVSADLQKVIMLPRLDMFKEVIFTPRIIAFNESFVPVGSNKEKPCAILWHEAISGRSKSDITCAFHRFLLLNRDAQKIIFWLDNCSAQNKNWGLFCFFVHMINCNDIAAQQIDLKYFEPGHTFMSADSFHHQVEHSLKKKGKVYDFQDFVDCVENARPGKKIVAAVMDLQNFYEWPDCTSQFKLGRMSPRPYLHSMVHVRFTRGDHTLQYKNNFNDDFCKLNFLTAKAYKSGVPSPKPLKEPRGILKERKENIISKLSEIIPTNRISFWKDLPVSQADTSLDDSEIEDSDDE